jgi:hypothetical protein
MIVFLIDFVLISLLRSLELYLTPPLTNATSSFYLILFLAPAIFVIIFYARTHTTISWHKWIFFIVLSIVLFCIFLSVMGPILYGYSNIDCQNVTRSESFIQYSCICQRDTPEGATHQAQVSCSLNGFSFSPFLQIRNEGEWQPIP